MKMISIEKELKENSYPGRGIIVGRSEDGTKAVIAYFIMGRSSNSIIRIHYNQKESQDEVNPYRRLASWKKY